MADIDLSQGQDGIRESRGQGDGLAESVGSLSDVSVCGVGLAELERCLRRVGIDAHHFLQCRDGPGVIAFRHHEPRAQKQCLGLERVARQRLVHQCLALVVFLLGRRDLSEPDPSWQIIRSVSRHFFQEAFASRQVAALDLELSVLQLFR